MEERSLFECKMDNVLVCEHCGAIIEDEDDAQVIEGRDGYFCPDCIEEMRDNGEIAYCDCCGELHEMDYIVRIENTDEFWCETCVEMHDNHIHRCVHCDEWFDTRYPGGMMIENADGDWVCEDCSENHDYRECAECGDFYMEEDMYWDEDEDAVYCRQCWHEHRRRHIKDYSYKPLPKFKSSAHDEFDTGYGPKDPLYMGVELEIDADGGADYSADEMAAKIIDIAEEDIYCKHDGSLSNNGVEIVSHPCTLAYHKDELGWQQIMSKCSGAGYRSHDTSTCGLHVHVGRSQLGKATDMQELVIANLLVLFTVFRTNIVTFTRRTAGALSRWAEMPDFNETTRSDKYLSVAGDRWASRYKAINVSNRDTVEFRLFRGTLNYNTFIATLEFVSNFVAFAKTHTLDECRKADWLNVVQYNEYPELELYLQQRNLTQHCAPWVDLPNPDDEPVYKPSDVNVNFKDICELDMDNVTSTDLRIAASIARNYQQSRGVAHLWPMDSDEMAFRELSPGDIVTIYGTYYGDPLNATGIVRLPFSNAFGGTISVYINPDDLNGWQRDQAHIENGLVRMGVFADSCDVLVFDKPAVA